MIASVTTDARFFVVLAFIGFVCPTVMRCVCCLATNMTFTTGVPMVQCGFLLALESGFVACG